MPACRRPCLTPRYRRAGVKPQRYLEGFQWPDTKWRIGELTSQLQGKTVLLGLDDMDQFKGIEMKFLAFERVLDYHEDWRGKLVLVQVPRFAPFAPVALFVTGRGRPSCWGCTYTK